MGLGDLWVFENIHAHTEPTSATKKDAFFATLREALNNGPQSWARFLLGGSDLRWHTVRRHGETRVGNWVRGRGLKFLEEREAKGEANNRERWWEIMVEFDFVDVGSKFRKPPWLPNTYRGLKTKPGTAPSPLTHASLDRAWANSTLLSSFKDAQAVPHLQTKSHHVPLEVKIACKVKPSKPTQTPATFQLHILKAVPEAGTKRKQPQEEMRSMLPNPLDTGLNFSQIHANALTAAKEALNVVVPPPKTRQAHFKKKWLSEEAKGRYGEMEASKLGGLNSRTKLLHQEYHALARRDHRRWMFRKIPSGSRDRAKNFKKKKAMGASCVRDLKGRLWSSRDRAQVFADQLFMDIWWSGLTDAQILADIPQFLKDLKIGHRNLGPDAPNRPCSPYEMREMLRKLPGGSSSKPTGVAYEVWKILEPKQPCIPLPKRSPESVRRSGKSADTPNLTPWTTTSALAPCCFATW